MAMNIDTVKKLLDAIESGDTAAMAEVCKQLVAEAASGGDAQASVQIEPDGDEAAKTAAFPPGPGEAPMDDARRAKGADMDQERARARKAADEAETAAAEIKAMAEAARPAAKEALVVGLRARLGSALTPAAEKRIMSAGDFGAAKLISEIIEETIAGGGQQRARSGVEHESNPGPEQKSLPSVETLRAEGFTENWLIGYASALRSGNDTANAYLAQGRASARARTAQNGAAGQNGGK